MASAYVSNIVVNTGTDFTQSFTLEEADSNSLLDLSGYTVTSQMRKYSGSTTATNFTTSIISPVTSGKISIGLTSGQTGSLKPGRYVYDIVIEKNSTKTKVIEGMVLVREGVTR